MTGAFVIEGGYDDGINSYYGKDWTKQAKVLVINQIGVTPNLERRAPTPNDPCCPTDKGPNFNVNGRLDPVMTMYPGEVQMWRIVNTSGRASALFSTPPGGLQWRQLAQDGV